ncbi:MAG: nucleotide exchange factor GrpE [Chloroflexota bacterium]
MTLYNSSGEDLSKKTESETGNSGEEESLETLEKMLAEEKARADVNLAGWQRTQADFTNFKRRAEQEKEETVKFANTALLLRLLPIFDDLERAMSSTPEELAHVPWVEGVRLIHENLKKTLEALGLSPIKAVGEMFDPSVHEALMCCEGKEGVIIKELTRGYKFRDRLLRPSGVMVGTGEAEKQVPEKKE